MSKKINRREFLAGVAATGAGLIAGSSGLLLGGCSQAKSASAAGRGGAKIRSTSIDPSILAVAENGTPAENVRHAIAALGGISAFVKKGDRVAIKANLGWARTPAQAANTNPDLLQAVVKMCFDAGASDVAVVEHTCDRPSQFCFDLSGAKKALEGTKARLIAGDNPALYREIAIPKGKSLAKDMVMSDVLDADVFINIPIAKVHSASLLTLGMKNMMGVIWDRGTWHGSDLNQCIADFMTAVKPTLTILDANRILLTNGPKGPGETKDLKKVIAGIDPVAIDSYGATLFDKKGSEIPSVVKAHELGLGEMDLSKMKIKKA
jgi:uncharacterized protein (DUF362 family)